MINTKVTLAGVELKNPVMTASGTFGSGSEYSEFVDQGCGKCAMARESGAKGNRNLWRYAECHWPSESRDRCFL